MAAAVPLCVRRAGEGASGAAAGRLRSGLVAGQVALSFVLSIAATLAVRSLLHLQGIDTGFSTIGVQTMRVDLNFRRYHEGRSIVVLAELEQRVAAMPGVVGVGGTGVLPLDGERLDSSIVFGRERTGAAAKRKMRRRSHPGPICGWRRPVTSPHSGSAS